jgi:hypothetical protein
MHALGLSVALPTRLVLRPATTLRQAGLFDGSPDQLGVTHFSHDATGRVVGELVIGIASGLPQAQFIRVLAHEYAHALLAGSAARGVQLPTTEGFAECLAFSAVEGLGDRLGGVILKQIATNADPVYGQGFRSVRPVIQRLGLNRVLSALQAGRPHLVGLR